MMESAIKLMWDRGWMRVVIGLVIVVAMVGCQSAFSRAMERGDRFAAAGHWDQAAAAYGAALAEEPGDPEAELGLLRARQGQVAARLAQADAVRGTLGPDAALTPVYEALSLVPDHVEALAKAAELETEVLDEVERAMEEEPTHASWDRVRRILAERPEHARARGIDGRFRLAFAERAYERGSIHAERAETGLAAIHFAYAEEILPGHRDAAARFERARAAFRAAIEYVVVLGRFDADAESQAVLDALDPAEVAAAIPASAPISVVRETPPNTPAQAGLRLGGTVEHYRVDRRSSRRSEVCDYVCGTQRVDNPAYAEASQAVATAESALRRVEPEVDTALARLRSAEDNERDAERDVDQARDAEDEARSALSACESLPKPDVLDPCEALRGELQRLQQRTHRAEEALLRARQDVTEASQRLDVARQEVTARERDLRLAVDTRQRTPARIDVDRYCDHRYDVTTVELSAATELRVLGAHLRTDEVLVPEHVTQLRRTFSDEVVAAASGVCPALAAGDPEQLPGEAALAEAVAAKVAAQLASVVQSAHARMRETAPVLPAHASATAEQLEGEAEYLGRAIGPQFSEAEAGRASALAGRLGVSLAAVDRALLGGR